MIKDKITDEELDILSVQTFDLYHWKCCVNGCNHGSKVRKYEVTEELLDASPFLRSMEEYFYPDDYQKYLSEGVFAWIRSSRSVWVSKDYHWLLCAKHWRPYKARQIPEDQMTKVPATFTLLKEKQVQQKYSIIQKINW